LSAGARLDRRRLADERGEGSLEVVLVMPAVILPVALVIQFALWAHATQVAIAAAQDGAQAARLQGASAEAGQARALDFLSQAAPRLIASPVVTATRDAEVATVTVRGAVASLVPGLQLTVQEEARATVERFRPQTTSP
jgi:Flp pilus assembly protein TadG